MSAHQPSKVAGINPPSSPPQQTAPSESVSHLSQAAHDNDQVRPVEQLAALQDRLAAWISDLTTLHDLTERLVGSDTLERALHETLRAGAALVGARRGLIVLEPADGLGPDTTFGLGLGPADLGHIETVPRSSASYARILDGLPQQKDGERESPPQEITHPDIPRDEDLDPRHREVAARLGFAASYAVPLAAGTTGRLGAGVWLYDEPAEPTERQRHLLGLYVRHAAEHIARQLDLARAREAVQSVREELLPSRLPRVPGARLAVRHRTGPRGGGDWYDVLPLPEGALGLAVGAVCGSGPGVVAAMGRLRASLRAYAVMEGEDPVAVLSDLELLLRLTEPARSATALFGYVERAATAPGASVSRTRVVLAGAGHCPPLIIGPARIEFAETTLSAPLGMLACWEAPSVELTLEAGEMLLLYTDGLLHRTGEPTDRAFALLQEAATSASPAVREDPETLADHILHTMLPAGRADADSAEDVVILAAQF